ncbi:MAG TPA: nucleoside monophosphate kinase [Candidatus Babeliaceae bacterium]|nr:nucleoside monophosphate kinase [Candidatus Babeliaceae bacterium]
MKQNIVIFLGPPGSGKGSLAQLCIKHMGWVQLSTGNLCRQHIALKTEIGKQIDFCIKSGKLISDSLITSMVEEILIEYMQKDVTLLLDGFPRTMRQAQALDTILKAQKFSCIRLVIVNLSLSDDTILDRLSARLICQNTKCQAVYSLKNRALAPRDVMVCDACSAPVIQRSDDHGELVIRERLKIYYEHAKDLLDYYRQSSHLIKNIVAEGMLDEVFNQLQQAIGLAGI